MKNTALVLLTADTDCDGTSFGATRVYVPTHRAAEFVGDPQKLAAHAVASEQSSGYGADGAYEAITMQEFLRTYPLDSWSYQYMAKAGYANDHIRPRWNPWVYDDSIGIPALDHRYDD